MNQFQVISIIEFMYDRSLISIFLKKSINFWKSIRDLRFQTEWL